MLDIRKSAIRLISLCLLLVPGLLFGQGRSCDAQVQSAPLRSESLNDLLPDIVIRCTGGTPVATGSPIPTTALQVTLSVPITSRLLTNSFTEVLALLDEPGPVIQSACVGLTCPAVSGSTTNRNVYQAVRMNDNAVQFVGLPLDGGNRIIRITNLRGNIAQNVSQPVTATLSLSGQLPVVLTNQVLTMGSPTAGLAFSVRNPTDSITGVPVQVNRTLNLNSPLTLDSAVTFTLRFTEGFAQSFRKLALSATAAAPLVQLSQNNPAQADGANFRNSESGFYNIAFPPANGLNVAGAAESGTRLYVRFNNIPPGVNLYVTTQPVLTPNTGITARLISTNSSGIGPYSPVVPTQAVSGGVLVALLTQTNGTAQAVYEVLDPTSVSEAFSVGVVVSYVANAPPEAQMTVTGGLVPTGFSPTSQAPRFLEPNQNLAAVIFTNNPQTQGGGFFPGGGTGGGGTGGGGTGGGGTGGGGTGSSLSVVSPSLPQGTINEPYPRIQLQVTGGSGSYFWSISDGQLPPGMFLSAAGEVFGTPRGIGTYVATARVTDTQGQSTVTILSVFVRSPNVTLNQIGFPAAQVGQGFGPIRFTTTGGSPPFQFSASGQLPPGLQLSSDGLLSGTPAAEGTYFFTVNVLDAAGIAASQSFTLIVSGVLTLASSSPLPPGSVGAPFNFTLAATGGSGPYLFRMTGGALPPGVNLDPGGFLSGTPALAGLYGFTIEVRDTLGRSFSRAFTVEIAASGPSAGAMPNAAPDYLQFVFGTNAPGQTQQIRINNPVLNVQSYTALVETDFGGTWLSVSPGAGAAAFNSPGFFTAQADPGSRAAGAYTGRIRFRNPQGEEIVIPVVMVISSTQPVLSLLPGGLTFVAAEGGASLISQALSILNTSAGQLSYSLTIEYAGSPARQWLEVESGPQTGSVGVNSPATVNLRANPSGLPAGDYYAEVRVNSTTPGVPPQSITVVLNIVRAGQPVAPTSRPDGALFTNAASQVITLQNPTLAALSFFSTRTTPDGQPPWFTVIPASGSIPPGGTLGVSVQVPQLFFGSPPRRATLSFIFSDGSIRSIDLALISVQPPTAAEKSQGPAATCTPNQLVPVFTVLSPGFNVSAGWPTPVEVRVADDCGAPLTAGSVSLAFSNRDPSVSLASLRDGRWSGVWTGRNTQVQQVTVSVSAEAPAGALRGTHSITGTLAANSLPPVINSGGVVSAGTFLSRMPVAPGSLISIFGTKLADATAQAQSLPLATTLGSTSVTLGGRALPLFFASDGQVNAVVPYGMPTDAPQNLLIRRGNALSTAEPVVISAVQPDVFNLVLPGQSGLVAAITDLNFQLLTNANPLRAGDSMIIFCTGLGAVDQPVAAGAAAPSDPVARTSQTVTVTVGGIAGRVLFAGLTPGFTGLYQVAVTTDPATPSGNPKVEVVIDGRRSPQGTIPVR